MRRLFVCLEIVLAISPCLAANPPFRTAPGEINHVEGAAFLDGRRLPDGITAPQTISNGSILSTAAGRVEVLLDPGSFLRVGTGASLRFPTIRRGETRIQLNAGKVLLDLATTSGRISIRAGAAEIIPLEPGLYELAPGACQTRIYKGRAVIHLANGTVLLGKGREAICSNGAVEASRFDTNKADALYVWSAQVSEYEAAANYSVAYELPNQAVQAGWYWSRSMNCWAYVPENGIVPDPFGWSFAAGGQLERALILTGPVSHYPAAVDRYNLPRKLTMVAGTNSVDLARVKRVRPPDVVVPVNQAPGVPGILY